jgi:hypothetical protein
VCFCLSLPSRRLFLYACGVGLSLFSQRFEPLSLASLCGGKEKQVPASHRGMNSKQHCGALCLVSKGFMRHERL